MKRLIDSEKENVRESRALGKIDGKVAQEKGSTSSISFLRLHGSGEARGRRFCMQRQIFAQRLSEARSDG